MYVILSTQIEQKREFSRLKCSHTTYDHFGYSHMKNQEKTLGERQADGCLLCTFLKHA